MYVCHNVNLCLHATVCQMLYEIQPAVEESLLTRQKLRCVALQRDALEGAQYVFDISMYSTDMFVFIDERPQELIT